MPKYHECDLVKYHRRRRKERPENIDVAYRLYGYNCFNIHIIMSIDTKFSFPIRQCTTIVVTVNNLNSRAIKDPKTKTKSRGACCNRKITIFLLPLVVARNLQAICRERPLPR